MVMALDKCIGCHTCSVTCKQVWTNRPGAEYMWFNDVETKPGLGYPRRWEDQKQWKGGWELDRKGRLKLKAGGRIKKLLSIFSNPDLPQIDDYYEPWTYDYEKLITSPLSERDPVARARSQLTGKELEAIRWGPNWDDNLAGTYERIDQDPLVQGIEEQITASYEQAFMFYLPRICEHCLNPSCVASCPSGAMYKREEDGIVLVDQAKCRGWRFCVSGCPYKKVYFNHRTGKAEKCTLALVEFCEWWTAQDPLALEQHYVETFDLDRRCGLYLTFYGEGDRRQRGAALVRLKRLYRAAGLPLEGPELPDFLPVMLEFAAAAPSGQGKIVLRERHAALELLRHSLHDRGSPYSRLLDAICLTVGDPSPSDRARAVELAADGPPAELVGLEPFVPPEIAPSTGARR
jgi:nitrate reductase molybdenum cofactor assembly chaperone